MIMESVLYVIVSWVYRMNVKKTNLPREPGPFLIEIPAHRRSDQYVR